MLSDTESSDEEEAADLPWESSTRALIRGLLDDAEFDAETRTVTVSSEEWDSRGDGSRVARTFSDFEELRQALVEIGDGRMIESVPWEGGPVFSIDSDDIVADALVDAGVEDFFDGVEPMDDAQVTFDFEHWHDPRLARIELQAVNQALIARLGATPELLRYLGPREFEEVVGEIFRRMGYEVELTPRSKDGGVDLIAVQKREVGTLLTVVECKRYSPHQKVGVSLARALYGVVERRRASFGTLATTSYFTRGAREFATELEHRLSLRDFDDLSSWCRKYFARRN